MIYEYDEMRRAIPGSREPVSPHMLIQEMVPSRWAAIVGAVMCCRTRRDRSHPGTWRLLKRWPTPQLMAMAGPRDIADVIHDCGLHNQRARQLVHISSTMWRGGFPQLGEYTSDSDRIFGFGTIGFIPKDVELANFVAWCHASGHDPKIGVLPS